MPLVRVSNGGSADPANFFTPTDRLTADFRLLPYTGNQNTRFLAVTDEYLVFFGGGGTSGNSAAVILTHATPIDFSKYHNLKITHADILYNDGYRFALSIGVVAAPLNFTAEYSLTTIRSMYTKELYYYFSSSFAKTTDTISVSDVNIDGYLVVCASYDTAGYNGHWYIYDAHLE